MREIREKGPFVSTVGIAVFTERNVVFSVAQASNTTQNEESQ